AGSPDHTATVDRFGRDQLVVRSRCRIVHCIDESRMQCVRTNLAMFVDCEEAHLQILARGRPFLNDALDRSAARFPRWASLSHQLHHEKARRVADHLLTDTRRSGGAYLVVGIETGTDDGTVADAAVHLPRHATGGARTGELAVRIECEDAERIVIVLVAGNTRTLDVH